MITVSINIIGSLERVWEFWNNPDCIQKWYFASDDWHCPKATNDFQIDKNFSIRMEAKDGSIGFDFEGKYNKIINLQKIEYFITDGRKVNITFEKLNNSILVTQNFDAETQNSLELQKNGWQSILNNFKLYVESQHSL